jgi:hypothetical protein
MRNAFEPLTENETALVWKKMYEAEVRSLYFGDMAVRHVRVKQLMNGLVLFLSSGAAVTVATSLPKSVPILMSLLVAGITAYAIATNLDKRIDAISKLHDEWNQLNSDYEHLWHHWHEKGAEQLLEELLRRGRDASQAATEIPFNEKTMDKWEQVVSSRLKQVAAST